MSAATDRAIHVQAARRRLIDIAVENVKAFLDGHPRNVVNARQLV